MNKVEISYLLNTYSHLQWQVNIIKEKQITWLPIFSYKDSEFGFTKDGCWIVSSREQLVFLGENNFWIPLLPILEQDYEIFLNNVKDYLSNLYLPFSLLSTLPLLETVICGLEQGSDYWAGLAIKWIDSCQTLQKHELIPKLEHVLQAKWASQKVRQKTKKILIILSKHQSTEVIAINKLRKIQHLSKEQLARLLNVDSADNIIQLENNIDIYLNTLCRYVEATGGKLDIIAHYPDKNNLRIKSAKIGINT